MRSPRVLILWPVLATSLAATLLAAPTATQPAAKDKPVTYGRGQQIATLAHKRIKESSGLAVSRRRPGVFWTHNDSGDRPRLYAFTKSGKHVGTYPVAGATHVDWEDLASFTVDGAAYLLIADTGDNDKERRSCRLYIVSEPAPATATRPAGRPTVRRTITFTYANGPRDCEAVAVDVGGRAIYLISKRKRPSCTVYRLPLELDASTATQPSKPAIEIAQPVTGLALTMVTGMDISPDGRRAVVVTYGDAFEYARRGDETWDNAFTRRPRRIALPPRRQGESICYGADGKTLYVTSEKRPTPLIEVGFISD